MDKHQKRPIGTDKNILHSICLDEKNIDLLIDELRDNIKLNETTIPKCVTMIRRTMEQNIDRLSRPPKNRDELREFVNYLNKLCVGSIVEYVVKKNPNLYINKKKHPNKEQIKRDLDVYGKRDCTISSRPHTNTTKSYDHEDDDTKYITRRPTKTQPSHDDEFLNMQPNDTGFAGTDGSSSMYASPWDNNSITQVSGGQSQSTFNNPHTQRNPDELSQRYNTLMEQRRNDINGPRQPEEIDFTLDGSGDKVRREKMMRMQETQPGNMMGGMMSGMPSGMDGMGSMGSFSAFDDPYASLLGQGAPPIQTQNFGGIQPGPMMSPPQMSSQNYGQMPQQMPNYGNGTGQQYYNGNQSSAKTMQLTNDLERHLAERQQIDIETGQPASSGNNGSNQYGMGNQNQYDPSMMQNPGMSMMQNPMMQNPMMQNPGIPMMQNPMMQNPGMPMMQNPMMQNPMMQNPGMPMMQNPGMQNFMMQ